MAGGQGTRLAPFTSVLPKPLIPVGDRTVIEIIIDQFLPYGLDQFHLSLNYKSKILKSFFEELAPRYSVAYMEEKEPRGTAGVSATLYSPAPDHLIVTNCDIVIQADYADLVSFHKENKYDLTLVASLKDYHIPYGVCELEKGGSLAHITEKPQYSFLVNTGMYVVRRDRLDLIPENARCDMTDFIDANQRLRRPHRRLSDQRERMGRHRRMDGISQGDRESQSPWSGSIHVTLIYRSRCCALLKASLATLKRVWKI